MEKTSESVPELGEIVIATAREITRHGAYVTLDEYDGMRAFLHVSEIATGWVRHVERFVRPGQKIVLKVIRVNKMRREVDTSLRQLTGDEKKAKLIELKHAERAHTIMELVRNKAVIGEEESKKYSEALANEYDTLFEAMEDVARKGRVALQKLNLPESFCNILEEVVREKVIIPKVSVRGTIQATSHLPDGVQILKKAMEVAESVKSGGAEVKTTYLGAPRYGVVVEAENYKIAEKALATAVEKAGAVIESSKGTFKFSRED